MRQPTREQIDAILTGINHAASSGLTKQHDVAVCILVALDKIGYRVVRKPASTVSERIARAEVPQ